LRSAVVAMTDSAPGGVGPHVQSIVDALAQSLDRAVLLDDSSLTPITHSRQIGELDDVRMYSLLQRGIRPDVKAKLYSLGIGTATEAFWTPALPEDGMMARFCVPIHSTDERFGYLWVLDPEHSLSDDGQELARQAGRDLQVVLDRRNAALRAQESSQQTLLAKLLEHGTGGPSEHILQELQEKDVAQPDSRVSVFAFEPTFPEPSDPIERTMALRLRLGATDPSHRWFAVAGQPTAVLAVSRPEARINVRRVSSAVVDEIDATYGQRPAIGWSGDRLPISQAAQAFRNARLALALAEIGASKKTAHARSRNENVAVWTELGSWRTIAVLADSYSTHPADLAELVHPGIVAMIESGRDDLIHTLDAYLTHGGDARKTAESLHLHRSTLYYRLEKITEAIGGDLRDGEVRFELMLGLRLANMARLYRI
jgi:DNA-binding PucR family transcriptional regulator